MLLNLHNSSRHCYINKDLVTMGDHRKWLRRAITQQHIHIAWVNQTPVGAIRLDGSQISYAVFHQHQRMGYATSMIRKFLDNVDKRPILAQILTDNTASINTILKAGFKPIASAATNAVFIYE